MRNIIILVLIISLLLVIFINGCSPSSETNNETSTATSSVNTIIGTRVGNLAPDFQLQDIEGETVTLSGLRGNPVILNFWATWCGWCVVEMPYLQEIFSDWQDEGLVMLAINKGETYSEAQEFMESNNLSFTALLDTDEAVSLMYGVSGIPITIFIDKDGIIQGNRLGAFLSKDDIESYIVKIIP